jgi:hypothetical protein
VRTTQTSLNCLAQESVARSASKAAESGGGGRGGGREEAKRSYSGRTSGAGEGVDGGAWAQPCH